MLADVSDCEIKARFIGCMPHFVWRVKLKEMDCSSESIQFDVRSVTDALISVFIAGLLMALLLRCTESHLTFLYWFSLVSCDSSTQWKSSKFFPNYITAFPSWKNTDQFLNFFFQNTFEWSQNVINTGLSRKFPDFITGQ